MSLIDAPVASTMQETEHTEEENERHVEGIENRMEPWLDLKLNSSAIAMSVLVKNITPPCP